MPILHVGSTRRVHETGRIGYDLNGSSEEFAFDNSETCVILFSDESLSLANDGMTDPVGSNLRAYGIPDPISQGVRSARILAIPSRIYTISSLTGPANMDKVLSPKVRYSPWIVFFTTLMAISPAFVWNRETWAQTAPKAPVSTKPSAGAAAAKPGTKPAVKNSTAKPPSPTGASKKDEAKTGEDDGDDDDTPLDPSQTRKDIHAEIFRDPRAEAALDLEKFQPIRAPGNRMLSPVDIDTFRRMAGDPNTSPDESLITRIVEGQVAQLTDRKNIQALIDTSKELNPNAASAKAIQNSTSLLLEAIFASRSAKNTRFIDMYNKILLLKLAKVLNNHLIPRVQAMIVLGQSGNALALPLFLEQIKNPEQTALVKLWALRGIANLKRYGRTVLTANQDINTALAVADLLENDKGLPWPAQLRGLEVLGELRQGHNAAAPQKLEVATVAMKFLVDPKQKLEVRAEAARALGLMQISPVVTGYNYEAIAMTAGEVAAELGDRIGNMFKDNPLRSEYYTSFLIGPILEAFEGNASARDGGLVKVTTPPALEKVRQLLKLIEGVARPSVELLRVGTTAVPGKQSELASNVAALKDFLQKNAPKDRRLIPGGPDPTLAEGPGGR